MVRHGMKKMICSVLVSLAVIMFAGKVEASRRGLAMEDRSAKADYQKVFFQETSFDVYLDEVGGTMTIHGLINIHAGSDVWDKVDEVKRHFAMVNPNGYKMVYEFEFIYAN